MNAGWKKKWVEALRSGKYEKCVGVLKIRPKGGIKVLYCPFGVLCDIYDKHYFKLSESLWKIHKTLRDGGVLYSYDGDSMGVSKRIIQEMEMDEKDLIQHMQISALSDLNNANFNQVADYIEQNL